MTGTRRHILFVIAQAGQASYCQPLWQKWRGNGPDHCRWAVWASDDARNMAARLEGENLPFVGPWTGDIPQFDFIPDIIVSSATGASQERLAGKFARQKGAHYIQFIDTWYGYKTRIETSNHEGIGPDLIGVIDQGAITEAYSEGLPADKLLALGHPAWERALSEPQNAAPRDIVLFAAQPLSQFPELRGLGYDEHKSWRLLLALREAYPELVRELIYAPHPAQKVVPSSFPAGTRLLGDDEDVAAVAGTMVGMYTALMTEGFLRGQHVISLQPGLACDNNCALSRRGLVPLVTTSDIEDLAEAFSRPVAADMVEGLRASLKGSLARLEQAIFGSAI